MTKGDQCGKLCTRSVFTDAELLSPVRYFYSTKLGYASHCSVPVIVGKGGRDDSWLIAVGRKQPSQRQRNLNGNVGFAPKHAESLELLVGFICPHLLEQQERILKAKLRTHPIVRCNEEFERLKLLLEVVGHHCGQDLVTQPHDLRVSDPGRVIKLLQHFLENFSREFV